MWQRSGWLPKLLLGEVLSGMSCSLATDMRVPQGCRCSCWLTFLVQLGGIVQASLSSENGWKIEV